MRRRILLTLACLLISLAAGDTIPSADAISHASSSHQKALDEPIESYWRARLRVDKEYANDVADLLRRTGPGREHTGQLSQMKQDADAAVDRDTKSLKSKMGLTPNDEFSRAVEKAAEEAARQQVAAASDPTKDLKIGMLLVDAEKIAGRSAKLTGAYQDDSKSYDLIVYGNSTIQSKIYHLDVGPDTKIKSITIEIIQQEHVDGTFHAVERGLGR